MVRSVTISGPADAAVAAANPLRNLRRRMTVLHGREKAPLISTAVGILSRFVRRLTVSTLRLHSLSHGLQPTSRAFTSARRRYLPACHRGGVGSNRGAAGAEGPKNRAHQWRY